eukprot:scaffold1146_cov399-Prasinococcus_capsulatus_cf.AAC.32
MGVIIRPHQISPRPMTDRVPIRIAVCPALASPWGFTSRVRGSVSSSARHGLSTWAPAADVPTPTWSSAGGGVGRGRLGRWAPTKRGSMWGSKRWVQSLSRWAGQHLIFC